MSEQPEEEKAGGLLRSLPSRMLTMAEGEELIQQLDGGDGGSLTPLSVLMTPTGPAIATLLILHSDRKATTAVGYSPDQEGWVKIGTWGEEGYNTSEIENAVNEWAQTRYGDDVEYSFFDDNGEIRDEPA